ncbi:MAG: 5-histidylcysteine sulfoxide synthase [Flavobacteriaceae bacterium]|jgi:5-histidylcysteine sulfoxide synthase
MINEEPNLKHENLSKQPISLKNGTNEGLSHYFNNAWYIYEELFSSLKDDRTFYKKPDSLRNALIFYYGHTAVFYINKLVLSGIIEKGINPRFEVLFAKGVDPELPEHLSSEFEWPSVDDIRSYRAEVFNLLTRIIAAIDIPTVTSSKDPVWALHMGIEHDRIHFETSSVLIRQLDEVLLERPAGWEYAPTFGFSEEYELINVDGGSVKLGAQEPSDIFCWDNEFGQDTIEVKPFSATKNMITNGEFINFVKKGGYTNDAYWTNDGLEWKARTATDLPKFWLKEGDNYSYRAMFDVIEMPLDWPVEVNAFEANAFCKFMGSEFRLLSEPEFKLLTQKVHTNIEPARSDQFNLNLKFGSPSPVGYFKTDDSELFNDLYGNVWDWLSNDFYSLTGYIPHEYYDDFSAPYFDDKHKMLLGGSWSTTGTAASQYYRLWFREYVYQHAGFRLAKSGS